MAWTTPLTAVASTALTAAQWNASVRDNLLTTSPAVATSGSWPQHLAVSATNVVAFREIRDDIVGTSQNTTSTSYVDLSTVGPSVTLTTGSYALILHNCSMVNSSTGICRSSFELTGTTTSVANDDRNASNQGTDDVRVGVTNLLGINPGAGNVFTMKYRVSANTGTFGSRRLNVMAL